MLKRSNAGKGSASRGEGLLDRLYPEVGAGGFARSDQRVIFYNQVNALLRPNDIVLDFGAGNGSWAGRFEGYKRQLCILKGKAKRVIGVDVTPGVISNPTLDQALPIQPGEPLPLADASVDLILSWAVFEHIAEPQAVALELKRVLRPGGWLCAWTPNRWGYVGLGARLVPNALHGRLVPVILPADRREAEDVFPTYYRMNSLATLRALFPATEFRDCSYVWNGPPAYHAGKKIIANMIQAYGRLVPNYFGQSLHIFLQKFDGSKPNVNQ